MKPSSEVFSECKPTSPNTIQRNHPFTTVKNNRYQGNLIGCGVTYGHQWLLSTFWSLEASISVGYAHLTYDKYGPAKGDALIEKSHSNYVGPTQLGISFIYFIQ